MLALNERRRPQIETVEVKKIEREVGEPLAATLGKIFLQSMKVRSTPFVQDNDFTVEDRFLRRQLFQGLRDAGEPVSPVVATPRIDRCATVTDVSLRSITVQLDFMQPLGTCGRCSAKRGQTGLDEIGKGGALGALARHVLSSSGTALNQ